MSEKKGRDQKAVKGLFAPEFRNRLDAIISFGALSAASVEKVVDKMIVELQAQLFERKVTITLTAGARKYLATNGYDPDYGARPLRRLIMKEIGDVLTDEILFGALVRGGEARVDLQKKKLVFTYLTKGGELTVEK